MNVFGIGATDATKYGEHNSHRCKPIAKRAGEFVNAEQVAQLAQALGYSVKRVQRELTLERKAGIVPSWKA